MNPETATWRHDNERAELVERIISLTSQLDAYRAGQPPMAWHHKHPAERAIRADQRRLDLRELQATARDLVWLVDQLVDRNGRPLTPKDVPQVLDRIRHHARRLITTAERKAAA